MSTSSQKQRENESRKNIVPEEVKRDILHYWAYVHSLKQIGMPGSKARHIAYQRAFGKDDVT